MKQPTSKKASIRNKYGSLLLLASVTLGLVSMTSIAWAKKCSCNLSGVPLSLLRDKAEIVFAGVALKDSTQFSGHGSGARRLQNPAVPFRVIHVWKGDVSQEQTLYVLDDPESCDGFWFAKGEAYLVFAERRQWTSLWVLRREGYDVKHCNGTQHLKPFETLIQQLGEPLESYVQ